MPTKKSKTILGIDPGTNVTGYGIIEVCGKTMHCVVLGIIDLHRISDPYAKLRHIFDRVCALIDEYRPDEVALESPFFGQNVQSMLKLGRAQGVSIAAALSKGCPVAEYAPVASNRPLLAKEELPKSKWQPYSKTCLNSTNCPNALMRQMVWRWPSATISNVLLSPVSTLPL